MIRHTKRVTSPVFWKAGRKNAVWVTSPAPGPHPADFSIPLQVLVRDVLGLVETAREAKAAIRAGHVLVDDVPRKNHKFPVGLMDVVSIAPLGKYYRVVPCPKGLRVVEIPKKEASLKPARVVSKQAVSSKVQVTLHDGRNFLDIKASPGDTVVLKGGKPSKVLKLEKGALCLIVRGGRAGRMGKLLSVERGLARLEGNKDVFEAPVEYVMVIGEKEPVVKLYEASND